MRTHFLAFGSTMLLAIPAVAHHSWGGIYRINDPEIEISGVVTKVQWRNPHVRLEVTVDAGKPSARIWSIEGASVAQLSRMDVPPGLVQVGQQVKVAGYGGVQGAPSMYMNNLLLPDNREIVFGISGKLRWSGERIGYGNMLAGTIVETDINKRPASILAVWTVVSGDPASTLTSNSRDPAARANPRPSVSALAPAAPGSTVPVLPTSASYCAPKAMPQAMGSPYPMQLQKQGADVLIRLEEFDALRTVHIQATHDDSRAPVSLLGYSSGVWEGPGDRKLVVTTSKIDNKALGARARMTETFELSADRNRLLYTATMADPDRPASNAPPVVVSRYYQYRPGAKLQPYECSN